MQTPHDRGIGAVAARRPVGLGNGWSAAARGGTALAMTVLVIWLCVTIDRPGHRLPFITFFPAVMIAGWLGGLWPGVVSTLLCALSILAFGLQPTPEWDRLGLLLFVALGVFISFLNEARRRSTLAAVASEYSARASEHRLLQTLACVADAVITADEHGIVTGFNAVAERLTGCRVTDAMGRSIDEVLLIFHEGSGERAAGPLSGAFAGPKAVLKIEGTFLQTRAADRVSIEGHLCPIAPEDGSLLGWVVIFRDVSERRFAERRQAHLLEAEHELVVRERAARAESERASHLKDEFLAVLSHELRTPMNAVLGYARLLSAGALAPDRVPRALAAIHRNAQAQARLIESLLDSSRIVTGKLALDLGRVDLVSVAEAAVDAIRPDAASKGIFLHMQTPPDPITLTGDSNRLQQVFWNLLANAVKFTAGGGRIDFRVSRESERAVVTLTDTGAGIAADFLPYVFERFRQADRRSLAAGGLGLGLALVRDIVHAHGGTVSAASPGLDRGSTFTVTLPLSITRTVETHASTTDSAASPLEVLPLLTVLVVDDESDARDLLALVVESRGATAVAVGSVAEALEALETQSPELLLSDLRLPGEDGFSLIRRVRERERERQSRRLPAIAVSAQAGSDDRVAALRAGFDQHVAKPVDVEALIRAILRLTGQKN